MANRNNAVGIRYDDETLAMLDALVNDSGPESDRSKEQRAAVRLAYAMRFHLAGAYTLNIQEVDDVTQVFAGKLE